MSVIWRSPLIGRLALPGTMAVFLLLSLAYWWLGNAPHEIFGTALFGLLVWHLYSNRTWFRNLTRGNYDLGRTAKVVLHLALIANMAVLLVTSVVISRTAFEFLPLPDNIYLRDIHWFAAYWAMMLVGTHLGLHWARVMAMLRSAFRLSRSNVRAVLLRVLAAMVAAFGLWSFAVLGVWGKLNFQYSLDFWDFTGSVTPFFLHWAGVVALAAVVIHYAATWSRVRRRDAGRGLRRGAPAAEETLVRRK